MLRQLVEVPHGTAFVLMSDDLLTELDSWSPPVQVKVTPPINHGQPHQLVCRTVERALTVDIDTSILHETSILQDDLAELLRALEISDHARPYSPHEVMQREVLPAVRSMVATLRRL